MNPLGHKAKLNLEMGGPERAKLRKLAESHQHNCTRTLGAIVVEELESASVHILLGNVAMELEKRKFNLALNLKSFYDGKFLSTCRRRVNAWLHAFNMLAWR
jgi:hypothetical protein